MWPWKWLLKVYFLFSSYFAEKLWVSTMTNSKVLDAMAFLVANNKGLPHFSKSVLQISWFETAILSIGYRNLTCALSFYIGWHVLFGVWNWSYKCTMFLILSKMKIAKRKKKNVQTNRQRWSVEPFRRRLLMVADLMNCKARQASITTATTTSNCWCHHCYFSSLKSDQCCVKNVQSG